MSPEEKNHKWKQVPEIKEIFEEVRKSGFRPEITSSTTTGYHGTSMANAKKILSTELKPTGLKQFQIDAFLGEGRYFFEDGARFWGKTGKVAALSWARDHCRYSDPVVLRAQLHFKRLFDLGRRRNRRFFLEVDRQLDKKIRSLLEGEANQPAYKDWKVLKLIVLACPELAEIDIDGVRWNGFRVPKFEDVNQLGVCVKDAACIRELEILQ